ncbi:unnamed protein product [Camellia sinensis]
MVAKAEQERRAAIIRAEGESEVAKLISDATAALGMGLIELRMIEVSREIAAMLVKTSNVAYLPNANMLLELNPSVAGLVGRDTQPVMREAYNMFRDGGDPEKLVAAFSRGRESEYFYASLYAGLYYESQIPTEILLQVLGPSKVYKQVITKVINSTIAEYVEKLLSLMVDTCVCSVLEYVEGKWVCEGSGLQGGLGEDQARKYLRDIVSGLMYLHSHNIVNGDIKPDYLLVTAGSTVKIGDFNVSQVFEILSLASTLI